MRKSHQDYLRRLIGKAIAEKNHADLTEEVFSIKTPDTGIYRVIRDIVCDSRFYSVTDEDAFWKTYGTFMIASFLDSISEEEWEAEETLTMRKEDFLNEWMAANMIPITQERRKELESELRLKLDGNESMSIPDPGEHDGMGIGVIDLGNGIKDCTNRTGEPAKSLPPQIRDYMSDASGGNSPGLRNDGHMADVRFLDSIDPSVSNLAERIGRSSGRIVSTRGKFRPASKSDISGVTVGDHLGSLLPKELALLATPESEKVFLDRYARKKLQIFSSISRTSSEREENHGCIFICIDTSGSMAGEAEEMAKTLILAISIIAQRDRRPVCIFNYSDRVSFFVLKDMRSQRRKLLRFLSDSYGGGNDENKLFEFIFSRMPKMVRYREVVAAFRDADLLMVSDFRWIGVKPAQTQLLKNARKKGMRVFSVGIGIDYRMSGSGIDFEDQPSLRMSGLGFFRKSDFRYSLDNGIIKQMR